MKACKVLIPFLTLLWSSLFGEWSNPINLLTAKSAQNPSVGVDSYGNAVIISTVSDDGVIFYAAAAQLIRGIKKNVQPFIPAGIGQGVHAISVNTFGNAAAVWIEQDPNEFNYFLRSSFLVNNQWSSSSTISDCPNFNVEHFILPSIHVDSSSNALAVWPSQNNCELTFHVPEHRFTHAELQKHQDIFRTSDFLTSVSLSAEPSGKALAIWCTEDPFILQAAYYNGTSWDISKVSTNVFPTGIPLACASMNSAAQALLLWNNKSENGLSSKSFEKGNYGEEQLVYSPLPNETITSIKAVLDHQGNGVALWITFDNQEYKTLTSRYSEGVWGKVLVLDSSKYKLSNPNIALDDQGNGLAVWEKVDALENGSIYCRQYKNGSWIRGCTLLSSPDKSAKAPKLAMNSYGAATVVWSLQEPQAQTIQAVYTRNRNPLPPQNFQVKQIKNEFLLQTDYVNVLTWSPSPDSQVKSYYLYRNGTLLAVIQADRPLKYQDHHRNKKGRGVYFLTSVNNNGDQSSPLTLTLK